MCSNTAANLTFLVYFGLMYPLVFAFNRVEIDIYFKEAAVTSIM